MVAKVMTAGLLAGAFVLVAPVKAEAQDFGIGVQIGYPHYDYSHRDYYEHQRFEEERREAYARQQEFLRQQAWQRQQAWERQQAYARHEAWEHSREYRDRDDRFRGDRDDRFRDR